MSKNLLQRRLLATTAVAGLLAFVPVGHEKLAPLSAITSAKAQSIVAEQVFGDQLPSEEDQLLLESDTLTYDNDRGLVIATGNVQIVYGKFSLVANKVEYNQQSGRLLAVGNVEIIEPNGNRIFAAEIDITDDFRDGFVSALNVATAENTRIAAESAERLDGETTVFNNGVYTACPQCKENPEKPPLWQIRAKKVIIDNNTRTVEYEDARFEFFGTPVARVARFSHADPAIKRKSGFLFPSFGESESLGAHARIGYFFNLAPNYDLTAYGTYYARQGFLGELEWRQRLENGEYSIHYAGMRQDDQGAFSARTIDSVVEDRHAVITTGRFDINDRWKFGWNALYQTDNNFARTYDIEGGDERDIVNEIYLTGLGEKNYFDLRAQDFLVQDNQIDFDPVTPGNQTFDDQQASVLPSLDYNAVSGEEFALGQVSLNVNLASVNRNTFQVSNPDGNAAVIAPNERFSGIEGNTTRISTEIEWKRSQIVSGAVVTGELSYRGDAIYQDTNLNSPFNPLTTNESIYRSTPAASLEIRYPLIAQSDTVSQIFEPIAQIIVRPDETHIGRFANEDAQSFVFDTSNLFQRDKFSGYDRVEGGTRANVGFRYSASFASGGSVNVVAGQSFHLAGRNSFASTADLTNAGEESGLETDRSDYVASVQLDDGAGFSTGVSVRLDEKDLGLKRSEVSLGVAQPQYSFNSSYIYTEAQPNYRFNRARHEIRGSGSVRLDENWRVFGGLAYDIETEEVFRETIGIAYDDDCFSIALGYSNVDSDFTGDNTERAISFSVGFRTLGGFQRSFDFDEDQQ